MVLTHRHEPTRRSPGRRLQDRGGAPDDVVSFSLSIEDGYLPPGVLAGISDAPGQFEERRVHRHVTCCLRLPTRHHLFRSKPPLGGCLYYLSKVVHLFDVASDSRIPP